MKTTEMIAKVKEANDILIVNERGIVVKTDSMRDLGFVLYEISRQVQLGGRWVLCEAKNLTHYTPVVLLLAVKPDNADPNPAVILAVDKIEYGIATVNPLEFDSFGELENWSHVSEEDATQLLTKAPAEPAKIAGINQLNHLFNQLGLNFENWYCNSYEDHVSEFLHNDDTELSVLVRFDEGTVELFKDDTCEAVKRFTITIVPEESNEPSKVPDTRTGYEVKAS